MNAKDKIKSLRLPEPLLRAHGTLTPLDDLPKGVVLGSAWSLEAICADVSALAADPSTPRPRVSSYPSPVEMTSVLSRA